MKIAMPVCGDRVSTVFDAADEIMIVEGGPNETQKRFRCRLSVNNRTRKVSELTCLGVNVLICGAVSRPIERMIELAGINVISFIRGNIEEVLDAYYRSGLEDPCFALPGCRGRRRLRAG